MEGIRSINIFNVQIFSYKPVGCKKNESYVIQFLRLPLNETLKKWFKKKE